MCAARYPDLWIILLAAAFPSRPPGQNSGNLAAFVPIHSGGAVPDSHRLPYVAANQAKTLVARPPTVKPKPGCENRDSGVKIRACGPERARDGSRERSGAAIHPAQTPDKPR
jgi:hypothetical protein